MIARMLIMKAIKQWISDEELAAMFSSSYWTDVEQERKKPFWIEDGNFQPCLDYLDEAGLTKEYRVAESMASLEKTGSVVLDLAAGIGWASALLAKLDTVDKVIAVELSKHRLELVPRSCEMFDSDASKIERYLGSFYDLKLPDVSVDCVVMVQAFHHANRPLHLLVEVDRVLKPGGKFVIAGEHVISPLRAAAKIGVQALKQKNFDFSSQDIWPPDDVLGDHYYFNGDYQLLFRLLGYDLEVEEVREQAVSRVYAAKKPAS